MRRTFVDYYSQLTSNFKPARAALYLTMYCRKKMFRNHSLQNISVKNTPDFVQVDFDMINKYLKKENNL